MHRNNKTPNLYKNLFLLLILLLILAACTANQPATTPVHTSAPSVTPLAPHTIAPTLGINLAYTDTTTPSETAPPTPAAESDVTPDTTATFPSITQISPSPDAWMTEPTIPTVSQTARSIYQRGIEMGNDPHAFSKIGDCQSIPTYFLSYFDLPGQYNLGRYTDLQDTINWYAGSFSRQSLSVKGGFNAAAILSPLRADPSQCESNENPIQCEFRLHHPSVAIISLEEWWAGHPENYEAYMRQIIEYAISQGVVPILATKADNLEGNNLINQTIAALAHEYDIPLWNFWAAVQPLPNHGLMAYNTSGEVDMFHLTHSEGYYFYNDPSGTQSGWSVRNLTALQVLDAVRRGLLEQP
jgi:hypothetical protein